MGGAHANIFALYFQKDSKNLDDPKLKQYSELSKFFKIKLVSTIGSPS